MKRRKKFEPLSEPENNLYARYLNARAERDRAVSIKKKWDKTYSKEKEQIQYNLVASHIALKIEQETVEKLSNKVKGLEEKLIKMKEKNLKIKEKVKRSEKKRKKIYTKFNEMRGNTKKPRCENGRN